MPNNTVLVYPLPLDKWQDFKPSVARFTDTLRKFPPGARCSLMVVVNWDINSSHRMRDHPDYDEAIKLFLKLPVVDTQFFTYNRYGLDIGSVQYGAAHLSADKDLLVCFNAANYFHRENWLVPYMEAFEKNGDALYGASGSFEHAPHIRTSAWVILAGRLNVFPHVVTDKEKGFDFEHRKWNLTKWMGDQELKAFQVTWDGWQERPDWRKPENVFRKGDQSNMLVWDRLTDIYAKANPKEKRALELMAEGQQP